MQLRRLQLQARTIIERRVGQLTHLNDDLLQVSRITTGRVQLRQVRVAVGGIVERAVESVRPLIGQKRHELTVAIPSEPIWLYAGAALLEQGAVNLLNSAAKSTDEGGRIGLTVAQDGDEVARTMRQQAVLKIVVLVAVIGYGQESDRLQSKAAGSDHQLVKPATFGKLQVIPATASSTQRRSS